MSFFPKRKLKLHDLQSIDTGEYELKTLGNRSFIMFFSFPFSFFFLGGGGQRSISTCTRFDLKSSVLINYK